jgi:hypothetical protein
MTPTRENKTDKRPTLKVVTCPVSVLVPVGFAGGHITLQHSAARSEEKPINMR